MRRRVALLGQGNYGFMLAGLLLYIHLRKTRGWAPVGVAGQW
ncbi:hypothetical protein FHX68_2834 [Microbacterium lacticum]|uniref:Uncharacterized protein n=1 Tax=Microbacterium lacticum TaxID=33885 RepID=A0A543K7E0_9MICO|nr:hypothetical protein [Microbacterium lacticum]TQM90980.1 hypothetical protein FHX68_2834 [Microbacterium lacticum]